MDLSAKYLVTGGSGFLGIELISRLTSMGYKNIVSVSRNEGRLVLLKEMFPHVEIITGDISDPYICQKVCSGVHGIFHCAAFKSVGLAEKENVRECVLGNIQGTLNLLEETRKTNPNFIVGISSDKAAQIKGVYGATKLIMERLFAEYEITNQHTKYRIVRFGNVFGSTASFITKWAHKMKNGEEIILTDPNATRFFFKVKNAVDLIFDCLKNAVDSAAFTPNMKAVRMGIVLDACMDVYGKCPVKIIGLQPGENLHETTDGVIFSDKVEQYSKEEFIEKFLK